MIALIKKGVDMNAQNEEVGPPLNYAILNEAESSIRILLESGANVNAQYQLRRTAVYLAAERGNESILRLLLKHGANVNARCEAWINVEMKAAGIQLDKLPATSTR